MQATTFDNLTAPLVYAPSPLHISTSPQHLQQTLERHSMFPSKDDRSTTAQTSVSSTDESIEDRQEAVVRASLVRCASRLVESGRLQRRTTVAVSDPAAKEAIARAALQGGLTHRPDFVAGPDPLASVVTSGNTTEGSRNGSKSAGWGSFHPHNHDHENEEPVPYGEKHMSTVASEAQTDDARTPLPLQ